MKDSDELGEDLDGSTKRAIDTIIASQEARLVMSLPSNKGKPLTFQEFHDAILKSRSEIQKIASIGVFITNLFDHKDEEMTRKLIANKAGVDTSTEPWVPILNSATIFDGIATRYKSTLIPDDKLTQIYRTIYPNNPMSGVTRTYPRYRIEQLSGAVAASQYFVQEFNKKFPTKKIPARSSPSASTSSSSSHISHPSSEDVKTVSEADQIKYWSDDCSKALLEYKGRLKSFKDELSYLPNDPKGLSQNFIGTVYRRIHDIIIRIDKARDLIKGEGDKWIVYVNRAQQSSPLTGDGKKLVDAYHSMLTLSKNFEELENITRTRCTKFLDAYSEKSIALHRLPVFNKDLILAETSMGIGPRVHAEESF